MTEDEKEQAMRDRRASERHVVNLPTQVSIRGQKVICRLIDISEGGALIESRGPVKAGDKVSLDIPNIGPTIATVVRITPSHIAMAFPGAVVISSLLAKDKPKDDA